MAYPPVVLPQSTPGKTTKILLFGCLGLVLLTVAGVVVLGLKLGKQFKGMAENPEKFIAEMVIKQNPDLELISVDKTTREVVIRDKSSGESASFSLDDLQKGKIIIKKSDGSTAELGPEGIKVKDKDGTETVVAGVGPAAALPDWVPAYPGNPPAVLSTKQEKNGKVEGTFHFTTTDPFDEAVAAYQKALEDRNFEVAVEETALTPAKTVTLQGTATLPEGTRTVTVRFIPGGPQTVVRLEYREE